jgi:hypothetical protein
MSNNPADVPLTICGEKRADGKPCQGKVRPGSGPCMWHAKTLKNKVRAWARNKTLSFVLTVFGGLGVFLTFGIWVYDDFIKVKAVAPARSTGSATTSGPNSPAVSGDWNSVTYGPPAPDKKDKKDTSTKE